MTPTLSEIQQATCAAYGLAPIDLIGVAQKKQVAHPRQVAMFLARRQTALGAAAIGEGFGGRDKTTVTHADRQVARRVAADAALARKVMLIAVSARRKALRRARAEGVPEYSRHSVLMRASRLGAPVPRSLALELLRDNGPRAALKMAQALGYHASINTFDKLRQHLVADGTAQPLSVPPSKVATIRRGSDGLLYGQLITGQHSIRDAAHVARLLERLAA